MDKAQSTGPAISGVLQTAVVQGRATPPPTLLEQTSSTHRIPVAGRIRAGIKVLTRRAEEDARAREIYAQGLAAGEGFETIEKALAQALPALKNPLTPKNVPWFTVRGEDFPNPEIARQIMVAFAEDRGDGVQRLYRFPVVFPADAWQQVMPHELVAWTPRGREFWSEYASDGQTRQCMTYRPVPVDLQGRRTIRLWGGRKTMLREANGGVCDPEVCAEFQGKRCNLSGRFIFFIPGIKSISAFDLVTNSFYAMNAAIQKFQTIGFMRGGRISGFLDERRTPFYLTKRLVEVSRIGEDGHPVRVSQWLIELEAPIDVTALLRADDGIDAVDLFADDAVARLEGTGPSHSRRPNPDPDLDRARLPPAIADDASRNAEASRVVAAAAGLGVSAERYERYADQRWGRGWKVNPNGRRRALAEVQGFEGDAEGFRTKIESALAAVDR